MKMLALKMAKIKLVEVAPGIVQILIESLDDTQIIC